MGNFIRRIFLWYGIERQLKLAEKRKKRQKLYKMDCDKEAERIVSELDSVTKKAQQNDS